MPYKKEHKPRGKMLEKLQRNSAALGAANMMNDADDDSRESDDDSRESDDMVWKWSEQGRNYRRNALNRTSLWPSWPGIKGAFADMKKTAYGQSEPSGESSDILKIKSDGSHADGISLTEFQVRPNLLPSVLSLATQLGMVGESQPPSRYVADPPAWFRWPQTAVTVYDAAQRQASAQQKLQQVHQTPGWGHQFAAGVQRNVVDFVLQFSEEPKGIAGIRRRDPVASYERGEQPAAAHAINESSSQQPVPAQDMGRNAAVPVQEPASVLSSTEGGSSWDIVSQGASAAAFLTQGMTTLANSIDGTRVQQVSTVAVAAGVGAMLGGVGAMLGGAALGAAMATQQGGVEAMPLDVPGLTLARMALGGYLQSAIDDTTDDPAVRGRLNSHKAELIERYLNDYRALYAHRAQPEFKEMFKEGLGEVEADLSSDPDGSKAWNSGPFISFVVDLLLEGQVRLPDNSQTGTIRNAFNAVGVFTFPRAAEVEAFGHKFLQKHLTGIATDSVSNEQVIQILLPAYMKDYSTLMATENNPYIQWGKESVMHDFPFLKQVSDEALWYSKEFSEHIMRELIEGTPKLLNQGELTGSANTMAAMLAGRTISTTPPPPSDNARRDGSIIILQRAERLLPRWPVHLSVDSYITLLQHTFGEMLGKDPHVWWMDPYNPQPYLPQNRCSLRNFLTTPFDHQLFHTDGNWTQELSDAVRLYRMSGALRQEAATTSHDTQMAEIESQSSKINAPFRDPAVETKRNDVQRWLQQQPVSGQLKLAPALSSFNVNWLDAVGRAYGKHPEYWSQQQHLMNMDEFNQNMPHGHKVILNNAALPVVNTLQSELGKRMPVEDMLHLPASQVAENLASQYTNTQTSVILAALISPSDEWPAEVPNSGQLRQDIRTWRTASRIEQALSQKRYNDYVQHALRGNLDIDGVLDGIVEQRLRDVDIALKPDTPLTIIIKAESWYVSQLQKILTMRVSLPLVGTHTRRVVDIHNVRNMTVTLKELVLGTWRPAFMAKLGMIYQLSAPISHPTPTIVSAQVKSDNPATPVLTADQIDRLTANITPADFALDNLALYLNPYVVHSVTLRKIEKGSLAADRLLNDIQGGEIAGTADDPIFVKAIKKLTAFRNGDAVPHAVMMAKTREGTLPIKDLLCLPLSQDRVALLSQRTGEYLLTTPQALQSGEMTDLLNDDTKDESLVKLLVNHMDIKQSFDSIVRHGNQMERYLERSQNLAKFQRIHGERQTVEEQWIQIVAGDKAANVFPFEFEKDLHAAYQNQTGYQKTLRPIIENLDRSPSDFSRAIRLYSLLHPLEGIEVRMAALSGEANTQSQEQTVVDNLLWDGIALGRGVDHHTDTGEELSKKQWAATREFIFSTAVAAAATMATGGAGAAWGVSRVGIYLMSVAMRAGLTGLQEGIKAYLEVNEQQRSAAKDNVIYAALLSIVGDVVMDKLAPAALKLLKGSFKVVTNPNLLKSMAKTLTTSTSDMTPLAKNWAASRLADKNALITGTVMGTKVAQRLGRPEPEIRQQIETTLAEYRQRVAIDKQTFPDELMWVWDSLDPSRTPGNHLVPYMEHQAPASTAYRTPESQLGEANLYRLSDEAAIKDFHAGSEADYDRLWQQAENQAEAYRRLYGSESAQAYHYYENGQQKISVKQPLPPGDTLGGLLSNGDNLAKALALVKTLESPAVAGVNPVDTLTNDLVNKLANNGIDCSTITRNNLSYDRASNTLSLSSMDNVLLADTVLPESVARMRGQIRELLENFPQAAKAQRHLALQDDLADLEIRNKFYNDVETLERSPQFSKSFTAGVDQFKRDRTLAHLVGKGKLPHNYQMMKDTELMHEVFTGIPLKLTPHELGEVSEFIRLARKQAKVQEVAMDAMTLAYQHIPETTRLSLHPQRVLTEAAGGRSRTLAYAMEVAINKGHSEQMLANLGRVQSQVDLGAGRLYIEALDAFHDQNFDAIETAITVSNREWLSVSEIVDQLKKESGEASFSLRTGYHAMSVGISVKDNGVKSYHFYEPNVGLAEYSSLEALGNGLEKTIGTPSLADVYKADHGRYKLYRLDVDKLGETPMDRKPEWKIADFSERTQPDPTVWVRTDGRFHKAHVESVCFTGRGKRSPKLPCTSAKNYQRTVRLSMASMARPEQKSGSWGDFINSIKGDDVKVLFSLDNSLSTKKMNTKSMAHMAQDSYLKQQLNDNGIEYVIDPKNAIEDGYIIAADADFTQPGLARDQVEQIASLVKQINIKRTENPDGVVAVHCGAGDGRSGTVKSAVMIHKLLREHPELYRDDVVKNNKGLKISSHMSNSFGREHVDNPAYGVVVYAINAVRVTHEHAVERVSDVNLLNAYARFLETHR
ncbi:hypothetical protein [Serratia entomophila]|uniref:hypothetical protein n=1 Tax=Serratia entomophila TaxID=42906 RepID=UPI00217B62C8|nr:hypothetical protein [Serratia entomophila]CAI1562130.1 Uncharacterised protein [Serratia entomophila]